MPTKLLICTNEAFGLGHLRTALKLSAFLQAELSDLSILLITGSSMLHGFRLPPRVDVVKLPSMMMEGVTVYTSKYLPLPFEEVKRLRERIILETALAYSPHLFLADFRPVGVGGELLPTLRALKESERTALALLFPDIAGNLEGVRAEWQADHAMPALEELYDEIWVYGCQAFYDPIKEYQLPDPVAQKIRFCGYLGVEPPTSSPEATCRELGIAGETFALVTVGNGQDGFPVLDAYLRALAVFPNHLQLFSLLVGGPDLSPGDQEVIRQRCAQLAITHPERPVRFIEFTPALLEYMAAADLVVSMGGYNTLVEILSLGKRAVVIPRVHFARSKSFEQFIRASLFERLGLFRLLHPEQLSPEALTEALLAVLSAPSPSRQHLQAVGFDLNGLHQVKAHVVRLLGERGLLSPPARAEGTHHADQTTP